MGRAANSSALISPGADATARGAARDSYNQAPPEDWANFTADLRGSLGVDDSLDAQCVYEPAAHVRGIWGGRGGAAVCRWRVVRGGREQRRGGRSARR